MFSSVGTGILDGPLCLFLQCGLSGGQSLHSYTLVFDGMRCDVILHQLEEHAGSPVDGAADGFGKVLILVKEVDPSTLKEGDIITLMLRP